MTTKERTCEYRIDEELKSFQESAGELVNSYYSGDDDRFQEWNDYPLAVQDYQVTKVELSWGGPSSFLKIFHDGTEIYSVEYHFQDWFDGASRKVEEGSNVWKYAETIIEAREGI